MWHIQSHILKRLCKGHCNSADKRAKSVARRDIYWQSSQCVWWLGGAEALRQCEVEVRPRRHGRSAVTCALTHASCSSLAPEDLLTVMSFDSCHLWVSSRSSDMNRVFFPFLFCFREGVFLEPRKAPRVTADPTSEKQREETLTRVSRQIQDTRKQQKSFAVFAE